MHESLHASSKNTEIYICGAGKFGLEGNLRPFLEAIAGLGKEFAFLRQNFKLVSTRPADKVKESLYAGCVKPDGHLGRDLPKDFWWADTANTIFFTQNDLEKTNPYFEILLPQEIFEITTETRQDLEKILVLCCSSGQIREYLNLVNNFAQTDTLIVRGDKGHIPSSERVKMTNPNVRYASISGPWYAEESGNGACTGAHVAAKAEKDRAKLKKLYELSPYFVVETSDDPEYLDALKEYKNLMTLAYGIAIHYLKSPQERTDFYLKLLKDFRAYAKVLGLEEHTFEDDLKNLGLAFLGDTWMCTVHGSSDLSGKRSRNYTVAKDVGDPTKRRQFQDEREQSRKPNDADSFVESIREKHHMRTIEGYTSFKALKADQVHLPLLDFLENALAGQNLINHPYLQLHKRNRVEAEIEKQDWFQNYKKLCFYLKKEVLATRRPANEIALVMTRVAQEILNTATKESVGEYMLKVLIDISQEEVNEAELKSISVEKLEPFAKGDILRALVANFGSNKDHFQIALDAVMKSNS